MSGLMFKPDLALKIVDGEKTQTRRPLSDKPAQEQNRTCPECGSGDPDKIGPECQGGGGSHEFHMRRSAGDGPPVVYVPIEQAEDFADQSQAEANGGAPNPESPAAVPVSQVEAIAEELYEFLLRSHRDESLTYEERKSYEEDFRRRLDAALAAYRAALLDRGGESE
jgi:hypothetical protein